MLTINSQYNLGRTTTWFLHQAMSEADYRNAKGERKEMKLILKTKIIEQKEYLFIHCSFYWITFTEKLFWFQMSIFSRKVLHIYCVASLNNNSSDQLLKCLDYLSFYNSMHYCTLLFCAFLLLYIDAIILVSL